MEYKNLFGDHNNIIRHQLIHDIFKSIDRDIEVKPYILNQNWLRVPALGNNAINMTFGLGLNKSKVTNVISLELIDIKFYHKNSYEIGYDTDLETIEIHLYQLLEEFKPKPNLNNGIDLYFDTSQTIVQTVVMLLNKLFKMKLIPMALGMDYYPLEIFEKYDSPLQVGNALHLLLKEVINFNNDMFAFHKRLAIYIPKPNSEPNIFNVINEISISNSHLLILICSYGDRQLGKTTFERVKDSDKNNNCHYETDDENLNYSFRIHISCRPSYLIVPKLTPIFQILI